MGQAERGKLRYCELLMCRSATVLLLCTAALSAQVPEYSVDAAFEAERSIDRVLEKVDAAQDEWAGERDFQSIDAKLKAISKAIVAGEAAPEFLRETTSRFDSISLAEFKIVAIRRVDALAIVDVRLELGGRMSGGLLSLLGPIEMKWSVSGEEWALGSATVEGLREVRAGQFHFTEITDETFGAIPSFKAQLTKDTDYWRGRLDASVGVSVYGHQGISLGDADGDGCEDIYISQPAGLPNRLYVNNGDGTLAT